VIRTINKVKKICLIAIISFGAHAVERRQESMFNFYMRTKHKLERNPVERKNQKSIIKISQKPETKLIATNKFHAIILPGQNGRGGEYFHENHIVNTEYTRYKVPEYNIDLGQQNCIKHFRDQINDNDDDKKEDTFKNKKLIACGVSQGTATLGNAVSQWTKKKQEEQIGCLVFESVLGSGNSAIVHTVSNVPILTYLPFARVWLPLGAMFLFPTYKPWGMQLVKSAKKLSIETPIIIMHGTKDPQLDINDAREFYYELSKRENKKPKQNVYLMEVNTNFPVHTDTLDHSPNRTKEIAVIQAIYKKHNLPYNKEVLEKHKEQLDLTEYQPDPEAVRQKIHNSTKWQRYLRNTIDLTTTGLIALIATYALPGFKKWVKSWITSYGKQD
jgi:hypothetical protein